MVWNSLGHFGLERGGVFGVLLGAFPVGEEALEIPLGLGKHPVARINRAGPVGAAGVFASDQIEVVETRGE